MPERPAHPNQLVSAMLGVCACNLEHREVDAVRGCAAAIPIASIATVKPARSYVSPALQDSGQ